MASLKFEYDQTTDLYTWERGIGRPLSIFFNTNEFECHDPSVTEHMISKTLVEKLDRLRGEYDASITITSAYRTQSYQRKLLKQGFSAAKDSQHVLGMAADIFGWDMKKLLSLIPKYFSSYGVSSRFIHVDLRESKPARIWYYKDYVFNK